MNGYDLRQMVAQPAWFGSTGYSGFAGAGQAIPRIIMHELSHSTWGAFPVTGRPDLTGKQFEDGTLDVVAAYREALREFMLQPPDRFEPLRDRFRNMPNLDRGGYPDLHHFGEADMISMTAGDLSLVPPVLRRYLEAFYGSSGVGGHDFSDWIDAFQWWNGLDDEDRQVAGEVFGLQHFPVNRYRSLRPGPEPAVVPTGIREALAGEERQRLMDFAEQLDEVKQREGAAVDAAGVNRGFDFWRGYLLEISWLHSKHPEVLRNHAAADAREMAAAFDFYNDIDRLPAEDQAAIYLEQQHRPFVADFPFLLKSRALVDLFARREGGREAVAGDEVGGIVGGYAAVLAKFAAWADEVLTAAHRSPAQGGAALEALLDSFSDDELRSSLSTVLDLMRDSDRRATGQAMRNLSVPAMIRLLELRPEIARNGEIPPVELLRALGITVSASREQLISGIARLTENTSGNFAIDKPYDEAVYVVLDRRGGPDPGLVLDVFRSSDLRLLPWIETFPVRAGLVFRRDPEASALLVLEAGDLRAPAPMLIHAMVFWDPEAGAMLLAEADSHDTEIAARTFNTMVYDVYWGGYHSGPQIDLSADAGFIWYLVQAKGSQWVLDRMMQGISIYRAAIARGELEEEYVARHIDMFEHLLLIIPPTDPTAGMLRQVIAYLSQR
jgi:hypothetical protein